MPKLSDRLCLFVHLPKTAGTTIRTILSRSYGDDDSVVYAVYPDPAFHSEEEFLNLSDEKVNGLKFVIGHFPYGIHKNLGRDFFYSTFVRNPVDRVISEMFHLKTLQKAWSETSISDIYDVKKLTLFDNKQFRWLSGIFRSIPFGEITQDVFEDAMAKIDESFDFVGITEMFDESMVAFSDIVDIPNPYYAVENKSVNRPGAEQMTEQEMETIMKYNSYDMIIFDHFKSKLNGTISSGGDDFARRVSNYARKNASLNMEPRVKWKV